MSAPRPGTKAWEDAAAAAMVELMALPADNPERQKLSVRLPYPPKKLDALTRSRLSRSPCFAPGYVPVIARPLPRYADWLAEVSRPRPLRPGIPKIPEPYVGCDWTTTNYVAWYETANGLRSTIHAPDA